MNQELRDIIQNEIRIIKDKIEQINGYGKYSFVSIFNNFDGKLMFYVSTLNMPGTEFYTVEDALEAIELTQSKVEATVFVRDEDVSHPTKSLTEPYEEIGDTPLAEQFDGE